jgi:hypothetical protein
MHNRQASDSSHALSGGSQRSVSSDDRIVEYVQQFRKDVESKFRKSTTNQTYQFPRRPDHSASKRDLKNDSFDSLKDVTFYDLESQNTRAVLLGVLGAKKKSETSALVEVIHKLGHLDPRYLSSQLRNCESTFFKLLYKSVQNKAAKDLKSKDSLNSCSVKTKQIFATEKLKSAKLSRKEDGSTSFQRQFIPGDSLPRIQSSKVPSIHQIVLGGPAKALLVSESTVRAKNASLSPRLQRSRLEMSLKPGKSEKQLVKASPNLMRSGIMKTSVLNSSSQARAVPGKPDHVSVFQAVRANFVKTKASNNKSQSRLKTPRPAEQKPAPLKSHISLTKEQLRSLIQKNIYKAPAAENDPVGSRPVGRPDSGAETKKRTLVANTSNLKLKISQ